MDSSIPEWVVLVNPNILEGFFKNRLNYSESWHIFYKYNFSKLFPVSRIKRKQKRKIRFSLNTMQSSTVIPCVIVIGCHYSKSNAAEMNFQVKQRSTQSQRLVPVISVRVSLCSEASSPWALTRTTCSRLFQTD